MFRSRSSDMSDLVEADIEEAKRLYASTTASMNSSNTAAKNGLSPTNARTSSETNNPHEERVSTDRTTRAANPWWFNWVRNTSYIAAAGMVFYLLIWFNRNGGAAMMQSFLDWVQSIGYWGNAMFSVMFVVISFPFILGGYTPLTLGAGAIYGVLLGTITVSLSSIIGATVSFFVSRFFLREWIERRFKGRDEFDFFMSLFAQSKENRLICILMRCSPIPYGIQNSLFAVTDISFSTYLLTTWIGLLPFQILWTHFGSTMAAYSQSSSLSAWQIVSVVVQVLVMILLFVYLWHKMKKYKRQQNKGGAVSVV
ncbi:hypothetical protein PROFUN_11078 [Planoprotostelium fungivorum]|uniref:VTT domain-containing protein n=1 Tax=Planoprotostelium fungivorum TaxID=1890364 RepID=A0A2P6NAI1_9EUKA|nr:hypothetical protein PROFUN_11078 [Planoprotostelium fungivorum]